MLTFEFCTIEWLWTEHSIRITHPGGQEDFVTGSFPEVTKVLTAMGTRGWDVAACAAYDNWLFWTMRRPL
ncbi:hypothetical protein FHX81_7009 [Saccharothrix saharensis]|uniref:DUF4177 domain-containing protein n=1 Tax=Saccharothrix saharensis TaxID=571190 RepID=A0A543JP64_9PSEU|nr:hypothetical protein [Saccharothrix saharensis]TQM84554.1 hypothetical protein FHX81_7009 [Saccharothrix saharensis]